MNDPLTAFIVCCIIGCIVSVITLILSWNYICPWLERRREKRIANQPDFVTIHFKNRK